MKFGTPEMLWMLAALVGPLIAFLCWAWRVRQRLITQFISSRLVNQLKVGVSPARQKVRLALMVAAVVFIVLALARPQWGMSQEEARQRGLDIIVAIDTSKSMLAEDVQPNRLARAKLAALDLLRRARTDRLGLVAFAGSAFLDCPLTLDDGAFAQSVNALDTKTISDGGTAIGDAIDAADTAFKNESDDHKVLVLFTDGEDHDSDAVAAARKAAKDGMVIFTIGIGSPEGELLRVTDEHGRMDYIRDDQGQPVKSKLDEDLLQQIASATKGFYLPLRGAKTMDTLYEKGIEPLPKSEKSSRVFQYYQDRFYWPLSIAILILIWEMFFPDRQRRRKKSQAPPVIAAETVAILLLLLLPAGARASTGSALREYDDGKFQDALKEYNKLLERKQDDPRLHFNTGAAAYQSKQLEQATNEFNAALMSPDLKLQEHAYYNLGNTLYRMGQQESDADKKQAVWENAIKNYESAAKLNGQDEDAKFNQQFVKQQLEELKKQQQQQKNSDKNQKQNKDKKDQQNQQQNQQGQQDKQNQQDQKKDQKDGQQDKSQNQDSKTDQVKQKSEEQKKKEEQEAKERQQQQQGDQQQKPEDQKNAQGQMGDQKEKNEEDAKRDAEMMAAGQMTPTQAKQLLDAQKDKERVFQLAPPNKNVSKSRQYKDW